MKIINNKLKFYKKNILVIGLGITGKSIIKFLEEKECKLFYWDDAVLEKTFSKAIRLEKKTSKIDIFDYVFVSPGISRKHFLIKKVSRLKLKILTDIDLFLNEIKFFNLKNKLICITGTNGKSTVAKMIAMHLNSKPLANFGNLVLDNIPSKRNEKLILELSSFQLDYTNAIKPNIAVITNIDKDHLHHHGTYKNYVDSKLKISGFQTEDDYLILNYNDKKLRKNFFKTNKTKAKIIWVSEKNILKNGIYINKNLIIDNYFDKKNVALKNNSFFDLSHNKLNAALSYAVLRSLNYKTNRIINSLNSFKGLPHRLELIGRINNIDFFNDSKATNVAATCSALDSFKNVILIAGGSKKGESFNALKKYAKKIQAVFLYGETAHDISKSLDIVEVNVVCKNLKDSLYKAFAFNQKSKSLHPILLSPASASFDFYENYQKRGDDFKNIFKEINREVA